MLTSEPNNTAELFRMLDRRIARQENKDRQDATITVTRSVVDTSVSSDTVSATTDSANDGFAIGQDRVGRETL